MPEIRYQIGEDGVSLSEKRLTNPFSYTIRVYRDGEFVEQPVDVPETFNYLMGLDVKTRKTYQDGDRYYVVYQTTSRDGKTIIVIWRDTTRWTTADYERDAEFIEGLGILKYADEILVNSGTLIPRSQSLDRLFNELMFS